jgi:hypothetical protein
MLKEMTQPPAMPTGKKRSSKKGVRRKVK